MKGLTSNARAPIPLLALAGSLCVFYVVSNMIVAARFITVNFGLGELVFPSSVLLYPIVMPLGAVLRVVYGKYVARSVIAVSMALNLAIVGLLFVLREYFRAPSFNVAQAAAFDEMFSTTFRVFVFSMLSYGLGEIANIWTVGKMMDMLPTPRTFSSFCGLLALSFVSSTFVGQGVDSWIFYPGTFIGTDAGARIVQMAVGNWMGKFFVECLTTPVTIFLIIRLLRYHSVSLPYDEPSSE